MIRIHTGGCPVCGSPIFVGFKPNTDPERDASIYFFGGEEFHGEIGSAIHSCRCELWATDVSMDDPETDDLLHDARREEEPNDEGQ